MALDRDIGVAVARRLAATNSSAKWTAWEMLSATGARGLRMLGESDLFGRILLSERNRAAVGVLERNARPFEGRGARVVRADARGTVSSRPFDYVDLDPFGSPLPFLDTAVASVRDGGVIAVTATDLAVLAGAAREPCERRYRARPLRGRLGPEGGLRILLATLERRARGEGRKISPLLAYVLGHHLRAYVRVAPSGGAEGTPSVSEIPTAEWDGPPLPAGQTFGPMWIGPILDPEFVAGMDVPPTAAERPVLSALLRRWREESEVASPLFYEPNEIARVLRLSEPPGLERMMAKLRDRGYPAARSHLRPSAFRTTAPWVVVAESARAGAEGRVDTELLPPTRPGSRASRQPVPTRGGGG